MNKKRQLWFSLLAALIVALAFAPAVLAQSAASLLKKYEGLPSQAREQKLIEGAKKEGKVVVYSFTAVDQLKPLLEEFQKKYPSINAEHYRANATGVFNKFTTEARAGQTLADVIDISAGETHTVWQMDSSIRISRQAERASLKNSWMTKGSGQRTIIS
jgi:iron(III) transport system substrate-binding protein